VAGQAGNTSVSRRERKIDRGSGMIELGPQPAVERVALHAIRCRELRSGLAVHRIGGLIVIRQVAGSAFRRQPQELAYCRALVAIFALHGRVSSQQREAILGILHLLDGDVPALNGVALCAVRTHFPLVDVGVALLAILGDVGEDRLDMALHTRHFFVHATKRVLSLIVIEFHHGTDRTPALGGVTVFTRNGKRAMRTPSGLPLGVGHRSTGCPSEKDKPTQ